MMLDWVCCVFVVLVFGCIVYLLVVIKVSV